MDDPQTPPEPEIQSPPVAPPTRMRARFVFRAGNSWVTITLLSITILAFILQTLTTRLYGSDILFAFGGKINEYIQAGQYWRLLTPVFLHGSTTHLLFNMYALYVIGNELERNYGHLEFALLYLLAGIGGTLFSYFLTPNPALGASGAIFGMIAADAILLYKNKDILGPGVKSMLQRSVMIIVVNLIIGLSPGIDNWGHVGGMMTGIVFAWFAGPMVSVERRMDEVLIHLISSRTRSIFVASCTLLVFAALIVFKGLQ